MEAIFFARTFGKAVQVQITAKGRIICTSCGNTTQALVTKQVAIGLSFMHENHIIHRDLSAMNIFIEHGRPLATAF